MRAKQINWTSKLPEVKLMAKTKNRFDMAKHFGVSDSAMKSLLDRFKIKAQPRRVEKITAFTVEQLSEMRLTKTVVAMSEELGVSENWLYRHFRKHGITKPVSEESKSMKFGAEVAKLVHTTTRNQICDQLKISHKTLVTVLHEMGLQDVFYTPPKVMPKKTAPKAAPAAAKIIYPKDFKITRHISEPCCDIRSPMKRESYDPKMHAGAYGYTRV